MFRMRLRISFNILVLPITVIVLQNGVISHVDGNPFCGVVDTGHYIDKTDLIKYFHRMRTPIFCTAPSKFGKSVNLAMMRAFYEINVHKNGSVVPSPYLQKFAQLADRESSSETTLFKDEKFFTTQGGSLPVLHYNFESIKVACLQEFLESMKSLTARIWQKHPYLLTSDRLNSTDKYVASSYTKASGLSKEQLVSSGRELTSILSKHFGKACLVLIDEFDSVVLKVLTSQSKDEKDIFAILKEFNTQLLTNNSAVVKSFLTGVTRLAKVYAPGNAVHWRFTQDEEMTPFFGFTEKENTFLFRDSDLNLKDIRLYYDGYRGQNTSKWFYNPGSMIQLLLLNKTDVYWSAKVPLDVISSAYKQHTPVRDMIHAGENMTEIKLERPAHEMGCEEEILFLKKMLLSSNTMYNLSTLAQFLYELGYFTDKTDSRSSTDPSFVLITPNKEVKEIFKRFIHKHGRK